MRKWLLKSIVATVVTVAASIPASPAGADGPPNLGGGEFVGTMTYDPYGLPPVNTPCRAVRFTFRADAHVALANSVGSFWVGTLNNDTAPLTGSGQSACENTTVGGGQVTIDPIDVRHPLTAGTLTCTALTGAYTRTLAELTAVLGGSCTISGQPTGRVAIIVRGYVTPSVNTGNGVTTSITSLDLRAGFSVVPA